MLWIIGLIMLWFRPSWGFLGIFACGIGILSALIGYLGVANSPEAAGQPFPVLLAATAIGVAIDVGLFSILGAIVVAIRGGKIEKRVSDKEIDAELARVRAEIAAREGRETPPSQS